MAGGIAIVVIMLLLPIAVFIGGAIWSLVFGHFTMQEVDEATAGDGAS